MSEGDLTASERMVSQAPSGNHISARAQEYILSEASASDARVVLLESVYMVLTLHRGRWERPHVGPQESTPGPAVHDPQNPHAGSGRCFLAENPHVDVLPTFRCLD